MGKSTKILCIGTLIMDIINSKVNQLPKEGECIIAESISLKPGGSAYSTSVNLSRLAPDHTEIYCLGTVGDDHVGHIFGQELTEEGVISYLFTDGSKSTSCNIILQEQGKDRRYIFCEGANTSITKGRIFEVIDFVKPDVIVLGEMPSLGVVNKEFIEIIRYAKEQYQSMIYIDLLVNAEESYLWLMGSWDKLDVIHCNQGEGMTITKEKNLHDICKWFLDQGVTLALVSDGDKGCCYGFNDQVNFIPSFHAVEVDATGAGDAMTAGTIAKLTEACKSHNLQIWELSQELIAEIVRYGCACGAIAVSALGCISDISKDKVNRLLGIN